MNIKRFFNLLIFFSCILSSSFSAPKIILKLDDFMVKDGQSGCIPTLEYLKLKQIKAAFGAVVMRVDSTVQQVWSPYMEAKNDRGEKLFELWHHGWDHKKPEFLGTGYDYQKKHFDQANDLILKYLGIQMHTFGSPHNISDEETNQVIFENPNYKVFMLSSKVPNANNGILYIDNRVNMENGTGNPQFDYFKEEYFKHKEEYKDYMILQGHPSMWTVEKLEEFKKIVDFLIAEGCEFVLPYEYYLKTKEFKK
ncbi:MAG: hypothetical protein PHR38_01895 [Bacteroidales bacterium]|nr:hypothetical protein [Bacteroidales bacterium]